MKKFIYTSVLAVLTLMTACQKEEQNEIIDKGSDKIAQLKKDLSGYTILGQHVKMAGVDKTLLSTGCPTQFTFKWDEATQKMGILISKTQPGNMPFPISVAMRANVMELNAWDKDLYKGNWVKLYDDNAVTTTYEDEVNYKGDKPVRGGNSMVKAYYNLDTHEIEMNLNYNIMNVTGYVFKQKVVGNRTEAEFEEALFTYEEALAEEKLKQNLQVFKVNPQDAIDSLGTQKTFSATVTYEKKATKAQLPLSFSWNGKEGRDPAGRLTVTLAKTQVGNQQIELKAVGRFHDIITKREFAKYDKYDFSNRGTVKLKSVEVVATVYSADGKTKLKTSTKGVLRMYANTGKPQAILNFLDPEIGLLIEASFGVKH